MSHLVSSTVIITDLDILKKTVASFGGLTWMEGQTQFKWYYQARAHLADSYVKEQNRQESQFGACEHAIRIKGSDYEIGVVKRKDGEGYSLVFDPIDGTMTNKVGPACEKLIAAYSEEMIREWAAKNGFMLEQDTDAEGNIVLTMTGN